MSSTSNPPTDQPGKAAEQIRCPLCSHLQEPPPEDHRGPVTCAVCRISFSPLASTRPERPSAPPPLHASASRSQPPPDTSQGKDVLNEWLSGEPIAVKEPTLGKHVSALTRHYPWLTRVAIFGLASLMLYSLGCTAICWHMQHSLQTAVVDSQQARDDLKRIDGELLESAQQLGLQAQIAAQEKARCQQLATQIDTFAEKCAASEAARKAAEDQFRQTAHRVRLSLATKMTNDARYCAERWPQRSLMLAAEALRIGQHDDQETLIYPALQLIHDLTPHTASVPTQVLGPVSALATSPNGHWLAAGRKDGAVCLARPNDALNSQLPLYLPPHRGEVAGLKFSPNGAWLFAYGLNSTISAWRVNATAGIQHDRLTLQIPKFRIAALAVSADSRWLVCAGNGFRPRECTIRIWDLQADDPVASGFDLLGNEKRIQDVAISPNGQWVAAVGEHGGVKVWNRRAPYALPPWSVLNGNGMAVTAARFTLDNRWLVTATGSNFPDVTDANALPKNSTIFLWDLAGRDKSSPNSQNLNGVTRLPPLEPTAKGFQDIVLQGQTGTVDFLDVTADGRWLVTVSDDKSMRMWDLSSPNPACTVSVIDGHQAPVIAIGVSNAAHQVATADREGNVCLWDLQPNGAENSAKPLLKLKAGSGNVKELAMSQDGRWLATICASSDVRLWSLNAEDAIRLAYDRVSNLSTNEQIAEKLNPLVETESYRQ